MTMDRRTFLKQLGYGVAGVGLLSLAPGCRTTGLSLNANSLPRSTPEAEGVSSAGILAFLDAIAQSTHELHSFMLVRHGRVVAEGWWTPYGPRFNHTMYSMSKSFTSTAVGFAVAEGRLTVNDKVVKFFPNDLPDKVSDNLAALRVRDLLSMSAGCAKEPTRSVMQEENWVRAFLAMPFAHQPGTQFMYNSVATYMCSAIVQKLTSQKILDYLTPRLFEPLGIEGPTWEVCPRGINTGGWGLSIQTEGLAKFGQLYLQQGRWQGRQILPASWVQEATTFKIQQPAPAKPVRPNAQNDWLQGYCYQFWRSTHNAFRGDGAFGQFTIVMPEKDAVLLMTGETKSMQGELDLVWEHILPAMKDYPLFVDRAAHTRLQQTLSSLSLAMPTPGRPTAVVGRVTSRGEVARHLTGKTFKLDANDLGLQSISFAFRNDGCLITFRDAQAEHPIASGLARWQRGETALPGTPPRLIHGGAPKPGTKFKIATSGAWKDENTFEFMMRYYETPHHDAVTCRFDGDKVKITFLNSITGMNPNAKDKRPVLQGRCIA